MVLVVCLGASALVEYTTLRTVQACAALSFPSLMLKPTIQPQLQPLLETPSNLSSSSSDPAQQPLIPISSPSPSPPLNLHPGSPFPEFSAGTDADESREPQDYDREARSSSREDTATDAMVASPASPEHAESVAVRNSFSYGYGYAHGHATLSSAASVSPSPHLPSLGSGLAQAMASKPTTPPTANRKRFSAPLPFTRLVGGGSSAVPVVNLGTVGREGGLRGGRDVGASGGHALATRGDVVWARWDYLHHR
jgi:hypothetical protein